jgi:hypothetical protein
MRFLAAALVLLLPYCAIAKKKPSPTTTPAKTTSKAPKDALLAAADEISRQVSALRGLALLKPLQRGVLSRDEIGAKLRERIAQEFTPEEFHNEARALKRIGLLPPDVDYEKLLIDLLMEQVAGFYDPFASKLYIADWLPLEMQRPALAHEIEHALQDQHFDLKKYATPIKDDDDKQLAHSALVEGDGTAVMLEFQAQAMGLPVDQLPVLIEQVGKQMLQGSFGSTPQFDKAPPFVKETLIFPYLTGLTFIESLRKGSPWTRIDEVFKTPPESTEQVMHPEKYLNKEHPVSITPTALKQLGGRKEVRRNVFGELGLKILFDLAPPPAAAKKAPAPGAPPELPASALAEKAAAGWGGDREVVYGDPAAPDGTPTVVDLSVWDSESEAKEAEPVAQRLMQKLAAGDTVHDDWIVQRDGDKLVLVFGAPKGSGAALAAEVFKSWKIAR